MRPLHRREALYAVAGALTAAAVPSGLTAGVAVASERRSLPFAPNDVSPADLARNETYWESVATHYTRARGLVNLEHGYWGKMAAPVRDAYIAATVEVNDQSSIYGRKQFRIDAVESRRRVAQALGVNDDEIVLTRNATEAVHNLIRQYRGLKAGDQVLYTDVDYPAFKRTMAWLEESRGVTPLVIDLPARVSAREILASYERAFDENPRLKLMLLTHASNQHGLVLPVAKIASLARERGIAVVGDCAQSWGLIDFRAPELGLDWIGFNIHKWIGSPIGVGALYMRRGTLDPVAPYPGETDPQGANASARIHTGTSNFAALASVPAALDFHEAIGAPNKEARLRYLRSLWTDEAEQFAHIEVLGGREEESWSGMAAFRIRGRTSKDDAHKLQRRLEEEFGIFTVVRNGLAGGSCVRVTPQVFTTPNELDQLVDALRKLKA